MSDVLKLGSDTVAEALGDYFKFHARVENVTQGTTLVLFKKLCAYYGLPASLANKFTTNEKGAEMLREDEKPSREEFVAFLNEIGVITTQNNQIWGKIYSRIDLCYRLDGIVFGKGKHASAVIMSENEANLPVASDTGAINFNGVALESYNFIKYDLLGLDNLNPIKDIYGLDFDWNDVYDEKVWDTICSDKLEFVFQFGAAVPGQMVTEGQPRSIEKLAEVTSINRPGPLNMGMNKLWIDIQKGDSHLEGVDLVLSNLLKESFGEEHTGLVVYQEDVMRICQDGAGFSLGEADEIRRAMGKKKASLMDAYKERFIAGWNVEKYGGDPQEIWDQLAEFAKYAFNKSHAIAYTLISYMNAKLLTYNFPEYMEWIMNNNAKKRPVAIKKCKERGYKITFPSHDKMVKADKFTVSEELKEIMLPCIYDRKFETVSDFLFSDMPRNDKLGYIVYGLSDNFCSDRVGLYQIVAAVPEKKMQINTFPTSNSFLDILRNGTIAGLWDLQEYDDKYKVTVKKARSEVDVMVYPNIEHMPADRLEYIVKTDLKYYGMIRPGILSTYPDMDFDRIFTKYRSMKKRLVSMNENDGELSQQAFYDIKNKLNVEMKNAFMNDRIKRNKEMIEEKEYRIYVLDVKTGYGYTKIQSIFDNNEVMFYTRDPEIASYFTKLGKAKIAKVRLGINSYINKNLDPIASFQIKGVAE
ncbi:DNA polymerase III subunit alpha [Enterococcus sp. AZ180]